MKSTDNNKVNKMRENTTDLWHDQFSYKIKWFDSDTQLVRDRIFKGKNAYDNAAKWGKKTLTNFNYDLIQTIFPVI